MCGVLRRWLRRKSPRKHMYIIYIYINQLHIENCWKLYNYIRTLMCASICLFMCKMCWLWWHREVGLHRERRRSLLHHNQNVYGHGNSCYLCEAIVWSANAWSKLFGISDLQRIIVKAYLHKYSSMHHQFTLVYFSAEKLKADEGCDVHMATRIHKVCIDTARVVSRHGFCQRCPDFRRIQRRLWLQCHKK